MSERALGGHGFDDRLVPVLAATAIGLGLYAALARVLRLEELSWIKGLMRRTL